MANPKAEPTRDLLRAELLSQLTRRAIHFPTDRQGDARALASMQPTAWRALINYTTKTIGTDREEKSMFESMGRTLLQSLEAFAGHGAIVEGPLGQGWIVEPRLPIIDANWIEQNASYLAEDAWFSLAAVFVAVSDQISLIRTLRAQNNATAASISGDPRFISAMAEVALMRTASAGEIKRTLADLRDAKATIQQELNNAAAHNARYEVALNSYEADWNDFRAAKEKELAALRQQVSDSIRLDASHNLWRERSSAHLKWSLGAFAVMLVCIIALVTIVLSYGLPAIEPTAFEIVTRSGYTTHKLIVISLCVIGAAWVLRFVARSIVENMSLRSDAQHRQSMLETYLALRGEVGLKDEERVIILNALFRPLPGQTPDENPPTPAGEAFQKLFQR